MNLQAIADAIAVRFASVTATNGTATETATGTADLPNTIGTLALLVYPPTGDLGIGVSRRRDDTYDFTVRLLRDPTDVPARSRWLYAWADALRDLVEADMDLGLAYVAWARVTSMRAAIDGQQYSSIDGTFAVFDVVEFTVRVRIDEVVTTVAI